MSDPDPYAEFATPIAQEDPYAGIATQVTTQRLKVRDRKGGDVEFDAPIDADDAAIQKLAAKAARRPTSEIQVVRKKIDQARGVEQEGGMTLADLVAGKKLEPTRSTAESLGLGTRGILTGAGGLLDIPAGAVNSLINLTGANLSTSPFRDAANNVSDYAGLPRPETGKEQLTNAVIEGGTSALIPAGVTNTLARGGGYVLGELAKAPVAQFISGAAGAGSGEVARQNGAGPVGQTLATLAGGIGAPVAATAASQGARNTAALVTRSGALDSAARTLQQLATNAPRAANLARYAATPVSGAVPTLGEVAGDAGLAGLQRGLVNTNPTAAAQVGERMQANALTRTRAAVDELGPGSPQRLQDVGRSRVTAALDATERQQGAARTAVDQRLAATTTELTGAADAARTRLGDIASGIGPTVDRAATGANARGAFGNAYDAARTTTREAYRSPAMEARTPVEIPREFFQSVRQAADDFYGDGGGVMPPEMVAILDDAAATGATTRTLGNIERRLADFAGQARMAGRRSEAAFAERIRGDFAEQTNALATPQYREALGTAREARAAQGRTFETGDAASAFATDRFGNPTVQNTELPTKLVRPGAPGGDTADGMISALGAEASERIAREEMRRLIDGAQTARAADALVQRHGEMLSRFPSLQADMQRWAGSFGEAEQAAAAARVAPRATPEEAATIAAVSPEQTKLAGTPLERIADPSVEPSSFVGQLLRRADGGRELRRLSRQVADDPAAMDGARRAMAEYIETTGRGPNLTAAGDAVPSANPTRAAISTVLERGGPLLTDRQRIVLQRINKELEGVNFAATAGRPSGSDTAMNRTFSGILGKQILGVAGPGTQLLGHALSLLGNGQQVQRFVTEAVLDPKFAAELLTRATPQRLAALRARLQASTQGAIAADQDR